VKGTVRALVSRSVTQYRPEAVENLHKFSPSLFGDCLSGL
jgi:hypothetical protein